MTEKDTARLKELEQIVIGCFAQTLMTDAAEISPEADFFEDLGGDSLDSLDVATQLEEKLGLSLPEEEFAKCRKAAEAAELMLKLEQGGVPEQAAKPEKKEKVEPVTRVRDMEEYKIFLGRIAPFEETGNPYFLCNDSPLRDKSLYEGREILNFSSYNYAGMSGRPETIRAAQEAAAHYGCSASASRLLGGEKPIHKKLEAAIAAWKHTEDAVVLVGGHSTNVTFVGNFCGAKDLILYDVLAHNSVHEGTRLSDAESRPFPHNNYEALENILRQCRDQYEKVLIVVEGVYSMDGDIAPIPEYVRIKKKYGCFLMVDEAHSSCVLGDTGGGVDEYFGLDGRDIDIKMGTLSKGLGTCGGYLAGDHDLVEYLRYNLPGFVFSVGISPPLAAATMEAIRLLQEDPSIMASLHRNIRVFREEAKKRRLNTCLAGETAVLPILVGGDEEAYLLSTKLLEKGVFAPSAVYPAVPRGKARLRFCVISEHTPEQIVFALDTLVETAKELGISLPE